MYSEPGQGTTFEALLPRAGEEAQAVVGRAERGRLPTGTETVLLAEDEPMVRAVAAATLRRQGYNVLEASDGHEALSIARQLEGGGVHLLLTDLVMPLMSGMQLAQRLRAIHPGVGVLLTSGYIDEAIINEGGLEPGVEFLQKPFMPSVLTRKVREVLGR